MYRGRAGERSKEREREKKDEETSSTESRVRRERGGWQGKTTGVTRTPRRKDEGASARSCSLRPRTT